MIPDDGEQPGNDSSSNPDDGEQPGNDSKPDDENQDNDSSSNPDDGENQETMIQVNRHWKQSRE